MSSLKLDSLNIIPAEHYTTTIYTNDTSPSTRSITTYTDFPTAIAKLFTQTIRLTQKLLVSSCLKSSLRLHIGTSVCHVYVAIIHSRTHPTFSYENQRRKF